jgi:hypothetical protein
MDKFTQFRFFEIWQPRWHDNKVLLAKHKVGEHNKVVFTKAPTMTGDFYVSGKVVKRCKVENNGRLDCYAVPLSVLEPLEISANSVLDLK